MLVGSYTIELSRLSTAEVCRSRIDSGGGIRPQCCDMQAEANAIKTQTHG